MNEPTKAVFLSYASQDAEAAKRIADALRAAGVEVWFDAEGGLEHGDEWDAKIRRQIKECVLFIAVISANTQAREEGYFRIEWELAAQRALGIASGVAFILPVVIDDTREPEALVPDRFRTVQWTKLPGGNVSPEVLQRFLKLWSHRTGALKQAAEVRGRMTEDRGQDRPPGKSNFKYYVLATVALLILAPVLYLALRPRRSPEERTKIVAGAQTSDGQVAARATATSPTPSPSNGLSEARQLAVKARAMSFDKYDSTADDFAAAESLLKRALELDPNDAEIWAVSSQLNKQFQTRGFDRSSARAAATLSQAQRAVKLDPDSIEAQFALGYAERGTDPVAAEQIMRRILARQPDHPGALFALSNLAYRQGKADESLGYLEKVAAQPQWAALAGYLKYLTYFSRARFGEAEQAIRQSIAVQPSANSVAGLAMVLLTWKGDADAAARMFAEAPMTMRNEPRTVWMTAQVQLCRRAPDEALKVLDRLPDDYIQDSWLSAPKAYYVGRAQALAGRPEAARLAWEAGLAVMQDRLKAAPTNPGLHLVNGELLALLGRDDEALREARTVAELSRGEKLPWFASPVRIYAELGRADDALPLLAGLCPPKPGDDVGWPLTPALLRLDPLWDKLRDDPRFRKLLVDTGAREVAAVPPRDWPKNPELKKAIELAEGLEAIPDDLALAEEIAKRAVDRSPTDVEAVTVMARVQSHFLRRGFDRSDERAALAKRYAERALQLAPDEPEAMYALATYHFSRATGETARTEQLLRRAMELDPTNPRPGRLLADLYNVTNRLAEAIAQGQENVRRFPRDVLSHYDLARNYKDQGRYDEFDRELDATLALAPLPNAIVWKARLQFGLRNDFAGMKAWLDRVPARVRGTERAVFSYFLYAGLGGDPETGLAALRDFPEKWFTDFEYAGPTALLNASLLELQGKTELARRQYEVAHGEIQRMRQTDPGRIGLIQVEFWTLLGLGRTEEAKVSYRRMVEGTRRPYAQDLVNGWWFTTIPAALLIGDRTTALSLLRESIETRPQSRAAFRLRFQIDSRMTPFRDDPEIKALLAEPSAAEASAGKPAEIQVTEDGRQGQVARVPAIDPKSVAVLAFANLSDDKANEYFSDGISEELLTVLQKIPGLHVAARMSAFSFKGKNATAQEIGEKLGVATLVEGSVRKAGNSVRITARLSRAATGEQLWSESYTRDLQDVFAVQSELAETIVGQLRGQLGVAATKAEIQAQVSAAEKGGTKNVQAHELYLQGKYFLNRATLEDTARATVLLQRAVELDPSFALAWAALSGAGWFRGGYGLNRQDFDEGFALARRGADRALALEPTLVAGHIARFDVQSSLDFDWKGSKESLRQAQALAPNDAAVIFRAAQLAYGFGQLARAEELSRQTAALDPVNPLVYTNQGYILLSLHRFDEAVAAFRHVHELSPTSPWGHAGVAIVLAASGRNDQAAAEAALESNEWSRAFALSLAEWGRKNHGAADKVLAQFIAGNADVAAYQIACVYAWRGEADHAFDWLERAYRQRDPGLGWSKEDFFLQGLHADPRWKIFLKKLGVADEQLP